MQAYIAVVFQRKYVLPSIYERYSDEVTLSIKKRQNHLFLRPYVIQKSTVQILLTFKTEYEFRIQGNRVKVFQAGNVHLESIALLCLLSKYIYIYMYIFLMLVKD